MNTDAWHERVDWENFLPEEVIIQSLDDADIQAEHNINDNRRIFRLTDFFVYDKPSMSLVALNLERLDNLSIAGRAIPMIPDDNAGEDGELEAIYEAEIQLSPITKVEYTYLDVSDAEQDGIYILTDFAWYLLERPRGFYRPLYQEPFRQFRLALVVLRRAYEHPEERLGEFIGKFRRTAKRIEERHTRAIEWGYPALHPADLQEASATIARDVLSYMEHITRSLEDETDDVRRTSLTTVQERLKKSSAISNILKGVLATIRKRGDEPFGSPSMDQADAFDAYDSDDDMMDEDRPAQLSAPTRRTCVTPVVERVARKVFASGLNLVGDRLPDVTWRESRAHGRTIADNIKLKRGQCVMTKAGVDEADAQQDWAFNNEKTRSVNEVANQYWFAQVLKTGQDGSRIHVRWFDHSAKSDLLKEFERPMELFLTNRCAWLSRDQIKMLVNVEFLSPEDEPSNYEQGYHTRFIRDHHSGAFVRLRPSDYELGENSTSCPVCDAAEMKELHYVDGELRLDGVNLHRGDFFVINPLRRTPWLKSEKDRRDPGPGQVVQITSVYFRNNRGRMEFDCVHVQGFERVEVLRKRKLVDETYLPCDGRPMQDERRLCSMNKWKLSLDFTVIKKSPIRKCFVRHPDTFDSIEEMNDWLDRSALHYITDLQGIPGSIPTSGNHQSPRLIGVKDLDLDEFNSPPPCARCGDDSINQRIIPMSMLDLFSGAGGLSKGLVESGICVPKYAVDHDEAACQTYRANFPGAKSIHGDVNVVLWKTLLAAQDLENGRGLPERAENSKLLPEQHEIDFICGGPPCQSFSGANRFKRDDDPRSAMVAAVLSAVEHYRPKYFLIENVPDALTHKLAGPPVRAGSADSEDTLDSPINQIEQGILRFLIRTALDLGYSFRVGVLQAAQYGSPQRRRRAYILGARPGLTLPELPLATHRIGTPETGMKLPTGGYLDALEVKSGYALHPAVTIWDAISDLKPFEWVNPHVVVGATPVSRAEDRERRKERPSYNAVHESRCEVGLCAGGESVGYIGGTPTTTYQMQIRRGTNAVTGHYTSSFKSPVFVERVVSIPILANADHRALPGVLREGDFLSNIFGSGGASGYYRGAFGRYDEKDQFATILTALRPAKKNGYCIHPSQKRMLSMRELARAQGFPDSFVFHGDVDQVNRQIGNAVVVQVSRAIGKEIKKAMITDNML
ncbi:DNA (cytosine-5-)-methyltransferase [Ceratobasidium sp. AG-Ba]|nr:DNA (cytosine-5-)-methyltransferase [Ceratobasidium sp. AG-Ba]